MNDSNSAGLAFLAAGGHVGALMRQIDWSNSPLGHPSGWPQSLRSVVSLILQNKFPMFVAWGPELGFLYNDSYVDILGAKHPQSLGCRFSEIWPEIWDKVSPLIQRALAGEASYYENLPLLMQRHGYDEQTWFTFSYSPVRDEQDRVAGMYCACVETTAQVLAEKYRDEEISRLRTLFAQAPGAMAILRGPDHVFDLANHAFSHVVGERPLLGKAARDALPELGEQGWFAGLDRVYASGQAYVGNAMAAKLRRAVDGPLEQRFLDFVLQPIHDARGLVTGIFVEGNDVTERRQAEAALRAAHVALEDRVAARTRELRETSKLLKAVFDRAPGGIAIADLDGRIVKANAAYQRLVRYSEQELLAQSMRSLTLEEDYPRKHKLLQHLRNGRGSSFEIELRYRTGTGEVIWVSDFISTIDDDASRPQYFVEIVQDIGVRKRAEREILASKQELQTLYDRLQTVREEERLALAREVHDQLGQLLSAAKIDIKLLEDRIRAPEIRLARRPILAELRSAWRTLEQSLDLVRKIATDLRVQDVSEQGLYAAISWYARDFERRTKIRCAIGFPSDLREPSGGVAAVLFPILKEALTNVQRHARAGRVVVSLSRRGGAVLLRIVDDGIGVSRRHARSIHAIGLAGMRERAALVGGRVVIGALRPHGTLVSARIPLVRDNDACAAGSLPQLQEGTPS